jgi:spermidine/putrescine transport system ATP-binding protein
MTVWDNVAFGPRRAGMSKDEVATRVEEMLKLVQLGKFAKRKPHQLSGGQQQRVALARSLARKPQLLLLDEPLGALDLKLREHMKIELKQLQADFGTTFVYITHDQSEALVLSDHVAVMNQGRFEQLGTPQSLYYEPQTPFVAGFVGANNRLPGRVMQVIGDLVELGTAQGLRLFARRKQPLGVGDAAEAFVRPEVVTLAHDMTGLPAQQPTDQEIGLHMDQVGCRGRHRIQGRKRRRASRRGDLRRCRCH